jgi:hypothetical protein
MGPRLQHIRIGIACVVGLAACRAGLPSKVDFAESSAQLQSDVQISLQEAWASDERIRVRLYVQNRAAASLRVDRDQLQLRLPDGRVLGRAAGITARHRPLELQPGGGHELVVDFRDPGSDLRLIGAASLIVGGVSFAADPQPRSVGEIALAAHGSQ